MVTHTPDGNYNRIAAHVIPIPPVLEGEATSEPPPPPPTGQTINLPGGATPSDFEDARASVSEDNAAIVFPTEPLNWTRGVTIPSSFPYDGLHIRGANFAPASTLYLPANYNSSADHSKVDQAFSDFQPASQITLTGGAASTTIFQCDRSNVTFSRLTLQGRGTGTNMDIRDTGIRFTSMSGCVVYYCRLQNLRGTALSLSGAWASWLATDNMFWQANYADGSTGGSNASFSYYRDFSTNPQSQAYTYGNTSMPYFQRSLVRGGTHAWDLGRAGRGAIRDVTLVNGVSNRGKLRIHGPYLFSGAQQYSGGPWEIYRNRAVNMGGTNPWTNTTEANMFRLLDAKGYNGIFHDNRVISGSPTAPPVTLSYEATSRTNQAGNPSCAELTGANYPYINQTTSAYFWDNLRLGSSFGADGSMIASSCAGKIIKIFPATVGGASQAFNSAHPTWADPGAHPLMPSDIP